MRRFPSALTEIQSQLKRCFFVKEKYRHELRARWGKVHKAYRGREQTATLFSLTKNSAECQLVDDATWSDLQMDEVFDRLDATVTPIGRHYLYRQCRTFESDTDKLNRQFRLALRFQSDRKLREYTQLNLMGLQSSNASVITPMLFDELPDGEFPRTLAMVLVFITIASGLIALVNPSLFYLPLAALLANFLFSETYSHRIGRHSISFGYLKKLLKVAGRLPLPQSDGIDQFDYLKKNRRKIRRYQTDFLAGGIDSSSGNPIIAQLAFFLNIIVLFDFLVFMYAAKRLIAHRLQLQEIYTAVASLDSAIAVASYLQLVGRYCNPVISDKRHLSFNALTHPLLNDGVPNSYASVNESALITGSNMAGKSTFIKAVGCNLILGQSLWICHAQAASLPLVPVLTSIKHADSIQEGKSYYFAEIDSLLRLVDAKKSGRPHVLIIDEILHGTNTVERVASAAAILEYLSENNTVLVTSHDVELVALLPVFKPYHFRETTDLDNMFDYKIHSGPCKTRNAIALLDAVGFPDSVIRKANCIAATLDHPDTDLQWSPVDGCGSGQD